MSTTPIDLYNEFLRISATGDEAAARAFLSEHIAEFPEETRNEILFAFVEEGLLKTAEAVRENATLQEQGVGTVTKLQGAKKELENDARIDELKTSLDAK